MRHGDSSALEPTGSAEHPFSAWLEATQRPVGRHALLLLAERNGRRNGVTADLRAVVRGHYLPPETMARRVESLGAPTAAALLREHFPTTTRARSADVGEILATEVVEQHLGFSVPIRRLRWKDGRDMALRGDDVIGIRDADDGLTFLKGEAKSRATLSASVVAEAGQALDQAKGRPTRHSVIFIADRLRDEEEDELAEKLETALANGFRGNPIEHMVFVLSGNSVETLLQAHLENVARRRRVRHAVGLRIRDHGRFIASMYRGH